MGDVFLDAFLDTLKVLPFLLVMNFLIEFIEYRSKGLKADKILKGGFAPLIGTAVGVVPQCGFSVVATELYSKRKIELGTLLAVYLATSDEALPILLSSYDGLVKVAPIIIVKVLFSLCVGYAAFGIQKLTENIKSKQADAPSATEVDAAEDKSVVKDDAHSAEHERASGLSHDCADPDGHERDLEEHGETEVHIHGCHHHSLEEKSELPENATKKQKAAWVWNVFLKHPLIHTGTVILFIFIVNALFGVAIYYLGEERISSFLGASNYRYLQPVLAALVGLIPNCAGSVVITELYVVGGLNLGGAAAGLCMSAGIGYAVLVRENRPVKNTVFIIVIMYVLSVMLGIVLTALEGVIPTVG